MNERAIRAREARERERLERELPDYIARSSSAPPPQPVASVARPAPPRQRQQPIVAVRTMDNPESRQTVQVSSSSRTVQKRDRGDDESPAVIAGMIPASKAAEIVASTGEKIVHWKDVHGIKLEEILEFDKMVRGQRFKPIPITVERIQFTLQKMKEEHDMSTQSLARNLYKGGCKSIWFRPRLFFGTERAYLASMEDARDLETAFSYLPNDDEPSVALLAERAAKQRKGQ
jgi:hypothetical protein